MRTWIRGCLRGLLALPLLAPLAACRRSSFDASAQSWVSLEGGAELGARVRSGQVEGLAHHVFRSAKLQRDVGLVVATPPEYAARASQRYPVIYMFPGIGGDEWAYLTSPGRDSSTLRALFARADTAPIIVFANPGSSGAHGDAERVLSDELVAFVDRTYRTQQRPEARSLEGFSLGGVTALTLLFQRPDVFGRAVAGSSACYLIDACDALRKQLASRATAAQGSKVLLSVGSLEQAKNAAVNDDLAPRLGVRVHRVPGVDHDWAAQLATRVDGRNFGELVADFHREGFPLQ